MSLHSIGTAAVVVQVTGTNWPKPAYTLLATGLCRFRIDDVLQETPYLVAKVTQLDKLSRDEIGENTYLLTYTSTYVLHIFYVNCFFVLSTVYTMFSNPVIIITVHMIVTSHSYGLFS